jgi:ankyrin repeat protein
VRLVIAHGALLEAFDLQFGTPLHAACAKEHVDCARVLLKAGEDGDKEENIVSGDCCIHINGSV